MIRLFVVFLMLNINANAMEYCKSKVQTFLLMKLYTITLCKQTNITYNELFNSAFSIELEYHMKSSSKWISNRSIEEMEKHYNLSQEEKKRYLKQMLTIFPNITKGDKIMLIYQPQNESKFYYNQKPIGHITDQTFATRFTNIWLHPNSTFKETRNFLFEA